VADTVRVAVSITDTLPEPELVTYAVHISLAGRFDVIATTRCATPGVARPGQVVVVGCADTADATTAVISTRGAASITALHFMRQPRVAAIEVALSNTVSFGNFVSLPCPADESRLLVEQLDLRERR
jgi:hypothetical protein